MDRRDPERHYDELESPENGRSIFWQQGEIAPDHVKGEGDFHGEGRPYRSQPNPVEDDMDRYRDMPLDGDSDDEGGNQFRTDKGILASKKDDEELEELDEATEPKGLGEIDPVKDNDWPSGEITSRPARDEMLGSVRYASDDEEKFWDQIVDDFENAKGGEVKDMEDKVAAALWLENDGQDSNIPVEHLGWDIVDVVEPSREYIEAANKYTMPMPQGITDAVHEALIQTNAWVENPEENGKLRPYKQYWSSIKPKIVEGNVQIAVEDPHMADIINHVARTDDASILDKTSHLNKKSVDVGSVEDMAAKGLKATDFVEGAAKFIVNKLPIPDALKGPLTKLLIILNVEAWPELAREEATMAAANLLQGKCPLCASYLVGTGKPGQIGVSSGAINMSCPACQGQGTRDAFVDTMGNLSEDGMGALKTKLVPVVEEMKAKLSERKSQPYRVEDPLGEGPVERIPMSEGERQLDKAIDKVDPTGYEAWPSGHGEAVGDRDPETGRMRPRQQRQPAGDRPWEDPTIPNPPSEWERALEEDPNIYGVPQNQQQQQQQTPNGKGFMTGVVPVGAAALGLAGMETLKRAIDPSKMMPDYTMIRNTSTEELQH